MSLKELLSSYQKFEPLEGCHLHGEYFDIVLDQYQGLIEEPLVVHSENYEVDVNTSKNKRSPHYEAVDVDEFDIHIEFNQDDFTVDKKYLVLIRMVIKTGDHNKHNNLLIIDSEQKAVYRFDPYVGDEKYNKLTMKVNDGLKDFFMDLLPEYKYSELSFHPQTRTQPCDICLAYVIKVAVLLVLDLDIVSNFGSKDHNDILRFANAVEHFADSEYGWPWSKPQNNKIPTNVPAPAYKGTNYGNPMKAQNIPIKKYNSPVTSDKYLGGAAAAADINQNNLNKALKKK